ncbi:alpha/beta fold hydrolase [Streptomyces europaeiscabiei]|uniref:alpha/beta fold hydrolase n=1 Tax=Streptomyces europaeiscabiei TaxID=146819 RepID=UPI0029BC39AB|nr:alpha/beta fold hydrolase [Streptomyces europaeiscabiei]MDX3834943.1 alpha/beta fold hydrolase [Streptomyces europaeiscabiei]
MGGAIYHFGQYELDTAHRRLSHDGRQVHVEPQALDLLCHLVEHRHRVVPAEELLDALGQATTVSEAELAAWLRAARSAIGDSDTRQQFIRTVDQRGHRFVARATAASTTSPATPTGPAIGAASHADHEVIRFCRSADGTRIAYATTGEGPPLVKTANWLTHLDLDRTTPMWAHWFDGLTRGRQLVRYDERGCGLSEWTVPSFTLDDLIGDLDSVADAVGLDRFPLLGVSQGGAVAVAYAAHRPERVSHLVLTSAYARGQLIHAASDAERDAAEVDLNIARAGWRSQDSSFLRYVASQYLADATPAEWDAFAAYQRQTTSPANGLRFLEEFARIDVSDIAHQVACPTLIIHSRDDARIPVTQALELATLIPDSRLILLESRNHLFTADDPAWPTFLSHLDNFLAE